MESRSILQISEMTEDNLDQKLTHLDTLDQSKVAEIASTIDIDAPQCIIEYGLQAQSRISSFSDQVITGYKSKDTGYVGEIVRELMVHVKSVNINNLEESKKGFFNKSKNKVQKFVASFESISSQIDGIVRNMEDARLKLLKDISMLDVMYEKNKLYIKELDLYILAGGVKLKELDYESIPALRTELTLSDDLFASHKLQETIDFRNQFEKKLHDLKLTRHISIQALPQVRMISITNQELVNSIQSSIINTIPLWKNGVINAVALTRQRKALEMQKSVNDMTNELLLQNSRILKENTVNAARETQRGIVDFDTIKQINQDLITTIEEVQKICFEGQEKRRLAENELLEMEENLKQSLIRN